MRTYQLNIHSANQNITITKKQLTFGGKNLAGVVAIVGGTPCYGLYFQLVEQLMNKLRSMPPTRMHLYYVIKATL